MNERVKAKVLAKMEKCAGKKKSQDIIGIIGGDDHEITAKGLEYLGQIGDEAACNEITHYLDSPVANIRVAACKAAIGINTEYMKTRVRYQLSMEKDPTVKEEIQRAFNKANN